MNNSIRVGMAEYSICRPPQSINTLGLGSCIGVVMYDKTSKWCGLAHIMLPDSSLITDVSNRNKFADTCLEDMYLDLLKKGVQQKHLVSKIAGGAHMFAYDSINENMNIGSRNVEATKAFLSKYRIPILAEHTGLSNSRTIEFFPETGNLLVKAVGIGIFTI